MSLSYDDPTCQDSGIDSTKEPTLLAHYNKGMLQRIPLSAHLYIASPFTAIP